MALCPREPLAGSQVVESQTLSAGRSNLPVLPPYTPSILVTDDFVPPPKTLSSWALSFLTLDLGNKEVVDDHQQLLHFGGCAG